jgi:steroid delta-isomerase-like uncharacterized protein
MLNKKFLLPLSFPLLLLIQCQTSEDKTDMRKNKNKELAVRFYNEALNKGNLELLNNIMSEDFIDYNSSSGQLQGLEGFKKFLNMVITAFPDLQIEIEDILAEGNKVIARLIITGNQSGSLGKIPPSNRKAEWTGIDILEIENNKIIGRWSERNLLSMMQQIGAIPEN